MLYGARSLLCVSGRRVRSMRRRSLLAFLQSPLLKASHSNVIVFVPFRHNTTTLCEFLQSYHIDVGVSPPSLPSALPITADWTRSHVGSVYERSSGLPVQRRSRPASSSRHLPLAWE